MNWPKLKIPPPFVNYREKNSLVWHDWLASIFNMNTYTCGTELILQTVWVQQINSCKDFVVDSLLLFVLADNSSPAGVSHSFHCGELQGVSRWLLTDGGFALKKNCVYKCKFTFFVGIFFFSSTRRHHQTWPRSTFCERFSWQCETEGWGVRAPAKLCEERSPSPSLVFHAEPTLLLTADTSGSGLTDKTRSPWYRSDQSCQTCCPALRRSYSSARRHQKEAFLFCKTGVHIRVHVNESLHRLFWGKEGTRRQSKSLLWSLLFHSALFQKTLESLGIPATTRQRQTKLPEMLCIHELHESQMKSHNLNPFNQFMYRDYDAIINNFTNVFVHLAVLCNSTSGLDSFRTGVTFLNKEHYNIL